MIFLNSLSGFIREFGKDVNYNTVYIDLVNQEISVIEEQLGGKQECIHKLKDDNNTCETCGAWVGQLGSEIESIDYYKHLYIIAHSFRAENIYIKTHFYYPPDFTFRIFGDKYIKPYYNYVDTYTVFPKVVTFNSRNDINNSPSFLVHFSKKAGNIWKSRNIWSRKFYFPLELYKGKTLVFNPDKYAVAYSSVDILTNSKEVYDDLVNPKNLIKG